MAQTFQPGDLIKAKKGHPVAGIMWRVVLVARNPDGPLQIKIVKRNIYFTLPENTHEFYEKVEWLSGYVTSPYRLGCQLFKFFINYIKF